MRSNLAPTPIQARLQAANVVALAGSPDAGFLHTVLCQLGLPRRQTDATEVIRTSGNASLRVVAGKAWDSEAGQWIAQPLPYGTRPRLALVDISTRAVLTRSREIEIGRSMRQFMARIGVDTNGAGYRTMQRQIAALAACEMFLGAGDRTVKGGPVRSYRAWERDNNQRLIPGSIILDEAFYLDLIESAVPLDLHAVAALRHSTLALDLYTWLAQRLCRVTRNTDPSISWPALAAQFGGGEYRSQKNFSADLRAALRAVLAVYPGARIAPVPGGLRLLPSPPPVPRTMVVARPISGGG